MIDHEGNADSITSHEIEGAFEIATIHNGHLGYFLSGCRQWIKVERDTATHEIFKTLKIKEDN